MEEFYSHSALVELDYQASKNEEFFLERSYGELEKSIKKTSIHIQIVTNENYNCITTEILGENEASSQGGGGGGDTQRNSKIFHISFKFSFKDELMLTTLKNRFTSGKFLLNLIHK
jgi:hypothetical protein